MVFIEVGDGPVGVAELEEIRRGTNSGHKESYLEPIHGVSGKSVGNG